MNDRYRLIELIVNADTYDSYECKLCTKNDVSCRRCGAEKFADYIIAHGVTVQECGEWEKIEDDWSMETIYKCSACKEEFVTIDGTPADNFWNYCPHCGAKMTPQPPKGE